MSNQIKHLKTGLRNVQKCDNSIRFVSIDNDERVINILSQINESVMAYVFNVAESRIDMSFLKIEGNPVAVLVVGINKLKWKVGAVLSTQTSSSELDFMYLSNMKILNSSVTSSIKNSVVPVICNFESVDIDPPDWYSLPS